MAKQSQEQGDSTGQQEISRREERAGRILDAAGALILRWGYNKTTIDDVSRLAGVAKGTIYLHWKSREELFAALMRRENLVLARDIRQRIMDDPAGGTLRGILKHSTLAILKRPLMKAVLLGDMEVLGRLTHREHSNASYGERLAGFISYLELLREHGLVRTDMSLRAQMYTYSAIFMGFFLTRPFVPNEVTVSDEEMAELMAETVHRTLEPPEPVSADALESTTKMFMGYLDRNIAIAQEKFQREVQ